MFLPFPTSDLGDICKDDCEIRAPKQARAHTGRDLRGGVAAGDVDYELNASVLVFLFSIVRSSNRVYLLRFTFESSI